MNVYVVFSRKTFRPSVNNLDDDVFACKLGKGKKTESKGIRSHQHTFKVNCAAIMHFVSMLLCKDIV